MPNLAEIDEQSIENFVEKVLAMYKVVVFTRGYQPSCDRAKMILLNYPLTAEDYQVVELGDQEAGSAMENYLNLKYGSEKVPQIFINGKYIGSCDELATMDNLGQLVEILGPRENQIPRETTCKMEGFPTEKNSS